MYIQAFSVCLWHSIRGFLIHVLVSGEWCVERDSRIVLEGSHRPEAFHKSTLNARSVVGVELAPGVSCGSMELPPCLLLSVALELLASSSEPFVVPISEPALGADVFVSNDFLLEAALAISQELSGA